MKNFAKICAIAFVFVIIVACGCAYVPPSNDKAQWYATIESESDKLDINANEWVPLFNSEGLLGGTRRVRLYSADLIGPGPIYENPVLVDYNSPQWWESKPHLLGTITVDTKAKNVVVDLQQITSKAGEPVRTEPSPANGTFPFKKWKDRLTPR